MAALIPLYIYRQSHPVNLGLLALFVSNACNFNSSILSSCHLWKQCLLGRAVKLASLVEPLLCGTAIVDGRLLVLIWCTIAFIFFQIFIALAFLLSLVLCVSLPWPADRNSEHHCGTRVQHLQR